MVVKNQYFIVLLMTLSLFIGNSKAGWKFWKKDKETTTTTTTTTPVSVNVQTTTISELRTNIDVSKSNIPGFGREDDQSYRKWAVDPIGTREPSQNQPSKIPQGSTINSDGSRPFPETMNQSAASRTSITNQLDSRSTSVSGNMAVESTQLSVAGRDERRTTSERSTQPAQSNQYNRPALPRDVRTNVVTDATTRAVADFTTKMYSSNPTYSKGNIVTDEDLEKLSEALYIKETNNANSYITVNLQKQTTSSSLMDQAPQPLLTISTEAFQIPTIQRVLSIFDNYQLDTLTNEYINPAQRQEESLLLDTFLSTNVMSTAMRFLADKGFVRRDYYEYKDILRRIWFNLFSRGQEEIKRRADYLGYIKKTDLGNKGSIIKMHVKFNNHDKPVTSMFVGISPELEMSLYTVCFYARPDGSCPVSLGGTKFNIITRKFRYRGKDLVGTAYPEI
ncbi:unnamed protein product [Lasius platythorax]|uniref:EndoU domain-containing protein n=1 Tax=Lasius platythorax TaxID=488582 RepID=A0AAV2NE92_9HYME